MGFFGGGGEEVNKSERKGLYRGDAFGDLRCSWGDGSRDHRGCAKGFFWLDDGKDLIPVRELVQALSWPCLQTSHKPRGCLQPFQGQLGPVGRFVTLK